MSILLKKILFSIIFNSSLLVLLVIGIQNSSKKSSVNLLINESINLPISFIVGSSFIFGSVTGTLISTINNRNQNYYQDDSSTTHNFKAYRELIE